MRWDEGAGRNQHGFALPHFGRNMRDGACRPSVCELLGCFLCGFWGSRAAFFAFSFAANSCFTLRAMALVFTLYVLAASRSTVAGFVLDAASRMAVNLHHLPRGECHAAAPASQCGARP